MEFSIRVWTLKNVRNVLQECFTDSTERRACMFSNSCMGFRNVLQECFTDPTNRRACKFYKNNGEH